MNHVEEAKRIESMSTDIDFSHTMTVPLSEIVSLNENTLLRPVDTKSEEFKHLCENIKARGLMNPPTVFKLGNKFCIIAGNHRTAACRALNFDSIEVKYFPNVHELEDVQALQFAENQQRIPTKPMEFAEALIRYASRKPQITEAELAEHFNVSQSKVNQYLRLKKLNPKIQEMVKKGELGVTFAFQIAALPDEEQEFWVERAQTDDINTFTLKVEQRKEELYKARRANRSSDDTFKPLFLLRKKNQIEIKLGQLNIEAQNRNIMELLDSYNPNTTKEHSEEFLAGVIQGIAWCGQLDPDSVAKAKEEHETMIKERAAKRAAKQAAEMATKAAEISIEQRLLKKGPARLEAAQM